MNMNQVILLTMAVFGIASGLLSALAANTGVAVGAGAFAILMVGAVCSAAVVGLSAFLMDKLA